MVKYKVMAQMLHTCRDIYMFKAYLHVLGMREPAGLDWMYVNGETLPYMIEASLACQQIGD